MCYHFTINLWMRYHSRTMSRVCDLSGKKKSFGNSKKHRRGSSGGGGVWKYKAQKTKRTWKPNLRKVRMEIDGKMQTVKISMKMYKRLRKEAAGLL